MKVAILSGATRGVGAEVSLALAQIGYHICLLTHNMADAARIQSIAEKSGGTVSIYSCNVENSAALAYTYQAIFEEYGRIDLIFTNMGLMPEEASYPKKFIGQLTSEEWQCYLNSALLGVINSVNQSIPYLEKNETGGYIFTTALWGVTAQVNLGLYTVSRAAIQALVDTVNLESEQASTKIQAYLLQPGQNESLTTELLKLIS